MNNNQLLRTVVRNQYMVSTVLLTYTGTGCRPEYETMVFKYDADAGKVSDWLELDGIRTYNEAEAHINHSDMIFKWSAPA